MKLPFPKIAFVIRLDLLLLIAAFGCCWFGYRTARSHRDRAVLQLTRLESAAGLPPIEDMNRLNVDPSESLDPQKLVWQIWVPRGKPIRLRAATNGLFNPVPKKYFERQLPFGRHRIVLDVPMENARFQDIWVDNTHWPIRDEQNKVTSDLRTPPRSEVVLHSEFQKATLGADEAYDSEKHAIGIKLWLQP
jgi:hypothetical protein